MVSDCRTACLSEQTADRPGEALPRRALVGQCAAAAPSQRIGAPFSPRIGNRPAAAEQPILLQAVERGIDCPLREIKRTAAAAMNSLNDRIPMRRAPGKRGEHDHVEMPFEYFAFHTDSLCLATRGGNL